MQKIIGLDIGEKRIGVAVGDTSVRIAVPVGTVLVDGTEYAEIAKIAEKYSTKRLVLGLPRNLKGQETAQTTYVRQVGSELEKALPGAVVSFQDESLTSVEAESRLKGRIGRPDYSGGPDAKNPKNPSLGDRRRGYARGEVDAEAATIILQDYLESKGEEL